MNNDRNLPYVTDIRTSRLKLLRLFGLGILLAVASVVLIRLGKGQAASTPKEISYVIIGIFGVLFSGLCSILFLWQTIFQAGQVIYELTANQITIRNKAAIPWNKVKAVSDFDWSKSKISLPIRKGRAQMVMLEMTEKDMDGLATSRTSKSLASLTKLSGYCGVGLPHSSTNLSYNEFKAVVTAYYEASRT